MCGIWCCISTGHQRDVTSSGTCAVCSSCATCLDNSLERQSTALSRRGPDLKSSQCFQVGRSEASKSDVFDNSTWVHMTGNLLWTQGNDFHCQPYIGEEETKFMLFNGDIYSFDGFRTSYNNGNDSENDGVTLFNVIKELTNSIEFCEVLGKLQGPFAFIYIDRLNGLLWFARDFFGRESLLFSYQNDHCGERSSVWSISSVSVFDNVFEIPAAGLYCLDLKTKVVTLYPYSHSRNTVTELTEEFLLQLKSTGIVADTFFECEQEIRLHFSTRLKVEDYEQTPSDTFKDILNHADCSGSPEKFIEQAVVTLSNKIQDFQQHLQLSVQRRVAAIPPYCKICIIQRQNISAFPELKCGHAKVGVLFSGGLDSTVLAYLAAEVLPEGSTLDLINVAFSKNNNFSCAPDRETALASYKMLKAKFEPIGKTINLILVNIDKAEVQEERSERIRELIAPLKSVLDDSLGCCLWFAARGKGKLYCDTDDSAVTNYSSTARVLLLGSGADELLGGYGRHRSAYERSGWSGLASEMQLEIDRISIRNLGRDNRIVSDHGVCPRMPFLDESVVNFLISQCDIWVKCCPVKMGQLGSRGTGEKLLLRVLAAKLFGNDNLPLALFPKRAMQFGSRIAKLENSKEKGGDSCQRLL